MNPLSGAPNRLQKFMVKDDPNAPFEERVPFGTPDWARYGSIPARVATHVLARPALDAMEHTHNVLTGKVDPWADLGPTGMMAGLVAGGGVLPGGPKGALKTGISDLKPFWDQEFMTAEGGYLDDLINPKHLAAKALHYAQGDETKALDLLKEFYHSEDPGTDPNTIKEAFNTLADLSAHIPDIIPLHSNEISYINSIPEHSPINPYKALADFKSGKISELPQHTHVATGNAGSDWGYAEGMEWEPSDEVTTKLHSALFGPNPLDKKIAAPSVIRRTLPQAIQPMAWDIMSNATPELRPLNVNYNPNILDLPNIVRAQDIGFNVGFPLVKGLDPNKFSFVDPPWSRTAANPNRGPVTGADFFENAFTDPRPQFGKRREHALFTADTPLVSNEYTSHFGGGPNDAGAQNFLLYGRGENPAQIFWPEVNRGNPSYNNDVMHELTMEMMDKGYDILGVHGINDLLGGSRGLHSQYLFARPEQLRSVYADFNPLYKDYPNLVLSQGSPFGLKFKEPQDDKSTADKTSR